MRKLIAVIVLFVLIMADSYYKMSAQTNVSPMPWLKMQYFNNNGQICAGCKLYTYQAGTTTPLATYVDAGGITPNANPVVADSSGRMLVFLSASAYKFVLTLPNGVQLWSIDNITSSELSLLASNNVWTGTNTYNAAVVFNSSATFNAGLTSTGPTILSGGGSIAGTFTGSPTFSGVPNFSGGFTATTGTFSGQIISTLITGTAPFVVASTTQVANLNVSQLEGFTWEVPGTIGSTTPNTIKGTSITGTSLHDSGLSDGCVNVASGLLTSAAVGSSGCQTRAITTFCNNTISDGVTLSGSPVTIASCVVTTPATGCPCRAQFNYATTIFKNSAGTGVAEWVSSTVADTTAATTFASAAAGESNASSGGRAEVGATSYSIGTFANSTAITFTLLAQNSTGNYTLYSTPLAGSGPSMSFQVAMIPSN